MFHAQVRGPELYKEGRVLLDLFVESYVRNLLNRP